MINVRIERAKSAIRLISAKFDRGRRDGARSARGRAHRDARPSPRPRARTSDAAEKLIALTRATYRTREDRARSSSSSEKTSQGKGRLERWGSFRTRQSTRSSTARRASPPRVRPSVLRDASTLSLLFRGRPPRRRDAAGIEPARARRRARATNRTRGDPRKERANPRDQRYGQSVTD